MNTRQLGYAALTAIAIGVMLPAAGSARPAPVDPDRSGLNLPAAPLMLARHGADDRPGDDRGGRKARGGKGRGGADDGPNHSWAPDAASGLILARHGADDRPGDDRGGRKGRGGKGRGGADDGPNHS